MVQDLDPPGVGARSLAECLALQAKAADRYDPAMARLIDNLELLSKGRTADLKRICGVDDEDFADMIRELRAYDPKPGCRFSASLAEDVTPDVFVRDTRGGYAVELNQATLPRVLVNRRYYQELKAGPQDKASRAWLSECLASAGWLVKALDQRARTIVKVVSEIVKRQQGFFDRGVSAMKPMTLREVADAIEMHESTVSRVTSNKYLLCDRGLFELKYFFGSGVRIRRGRWRGGRGGQGRDQGSDRRRDGNPQRRRDRGIAETARVRLRPAHRRQISRGDGNRLIDPAAADAQDRGLGGEPRPDREMVGGPPCDGTHVHAGRFDAEVAVDDDPIESRHRMARMEARPGGCQVELGPRSLRHPATVRHSLVSPISTVGIFCGRCAIESRIARICRRRHSPERSRCMPTMRSGLSLTRSSAITAPRGSSVGSSSAAQSRMPMWRFTRIALPCQPMLRVSSLRNRSACLRAFSSTRVADTEVHRLVHAVAVDERVRHGRAASAEALVGFLERNDIRVDLLQHVSTRCGSRRPSRPTALCML